MHDPIIQSVIWYKLFKPIFPVIRSMPQLYNSQQLTNLLATSFLRELTQNEMQA